MRPFVYRTTDFGKTWTAVVVPAGPVRGYAHVVKEDLVNKDLLFVGTELGLWVSLDGGKQWAQYKGGDLPSVAVRDLAIHPRDHDLVIATHGRGIWIVDDITPLRVLTPDMLAKGYFHTTGFGPDLMENVKRSVRDMIEWLVQEQGLSLHEAYAICSVAGDLKISEVVDVPHWGVSMTVPRGIFDLA